MNVTVGKVNLGNVDAVDVARMVASVYHFYDVDIEPLEPGRVKLTARAQNVTIRKNGTSQRDVCEQFINELIGAKV